MTEDQRTAHAKLAILTDSQYEAVLLLASGKVPKEIAVHLNVKLSTVRTHLQAAADRLKMNMYAICTLCGRAGVV